MYTGNYWLAIIMIALSPIDMLDGIIARANNRVTKFGGFLDSTLDRIGDFLIIVGLYYGGLTTLPLTGVLLLSTYLISYSRSRAELASGGQLQFNYGIIERPERIIYIASTILLYIFIPEQTIIGLPLSQLLIGILTILSIFTFGQRVYYAYKKL